MKMDGQIQALKALLDGLGVQYEEHEGGMVTFRDCTIFPSQTYDGKLFVRHTVSARVDTATEALRECGLLD